MVAKIFLTKPNVNIPINNQKELNSFIHRCIGKDNKYHNSFSDYAISSLQGGKLGTNGNLVFESNPYFVVSSENAEFISTFMMGIQFGGEKMFDMEFARMEPCEFKVHDFVDNVVTISPILIKKDGRKLTYKDEGWLEAINLNCKQKLEHAGINDNTFAVEIRNIDKAKVKNVHVGDVFNPCSMISLKVRGTKKARTAIYNMGIGNSTGSGFGSIRICQLPTT